jgi:hypothetical protein
MLSLDGHRIPVTVPANAVIDLLGDGPFDGNRMYDVGWEGKTLTMFAQDEWQRGSPVDGAGS